MAKFNSPQTLSSRLRNHPTATTNYEGGLAFTHSPKMDLYLRAASCLMGENKFYTDGKQSDAELLALIDAVGQEDPTFLVQLATYCRRELNLRSVATVLLVEATRFINVREWVPQIVRRADEPGEILAYYVSRFGRTFSRSLLKGLGDVLPRFNEYALAKYYNGAFSIRDVLRIVRPKPVNTTVSALWGRAVAGKLKTPHTWEVVISTKGSSKETWESVLPDMGIFAIIRNLRNLLEKGVKAETILPYITKQRVLNSRMLPFRFLSASKAIAGIGPFETPLIEQRLGEAIDWSIANVPKLPGRTVIAIDTSGSMNGKISDRSTTSYYDIASVLGCMAHKICDSAYVLGFDQSLHIINLDPNASVMTNIRAITQVGGATYGHLIAQHMNERGIDCDRLLLLSDMQLYARDNWSGSSISEEWRKYQQNHNARLYSIDLAGYGTGVVPDGDIMMIGGWNDRIFSFINLIEWDPDTALHAIAEYSS